MKEKTQMANNLPQSFNLCREIQYKKKKQWNTSYLWDSWKKFKTVRTPNAGEDLEKRECSDAPGDSINWYHDLGDSGDTIQLKGSSTWWQSIHSADSETQEDPVGHYLDRPLPHILCFSSSLKYLNHCIWCTCPKLSYRLLLEPKA